MSTNAQPLALQQWEPPELTKPDALKPGPIDARGADWSGQALPALDLSQAKLCRCDLRGSDLSQCNLEGADLRLARYDAATRWPEGFNHCESGAVGPGARLSGVYLNNADLRGMDLRGSVLMGLISVDLTSAEPSWMESGSPGQTSDKLYLRALVASGPALAMLN